MSLLSLHLDIMYGIADALLCDAQGSGDIPLFWKFFHRRRVLYPLLLVCRVFRAAFEPLLYHSLSIHFEHLDEQVFGDSKNPYNRVQRWLRLSGATQQRDLWRTLRRRPELGRLVRRLEVGWDEQSSREESLGDLEPYLAHFTNLLELQIGPNGGSHDRIPRTTKSSHWQMGIIYSAMGSNLIRLSVTCSFNTSILPHMFYLPHLEELTVSGFDPRGLDQWILPPHAVAGESRVTTLNISTMLSKAQWQQVLTWPAQLRVLKHDYVGFYDPALDPIDPEVLERSLQPFQHSLETLELRVSEESGFDSQHIPPDTLIHHKRGFTWNDWPQPELSLRRFTRLSHLYISSLYLFATSNDCSCNVRFKLLPCLPRSLEKLTVYFARCDSLQHCDRGSELVVEGRPRYLDWVVILLHKAYMFVPLLRDLSIVSQGRPWGSTTAINLDDTPQMVNVELNTNLGYGSPCRRCVNCRTLGLFQDDQGYYDDYDTHQGEDYEYYYGYRYDGWEYHENGGRVLGPLGETNTEHTDSPRGSDAVREELYEEWSNAVWEDGERWRDLEREWNLRPLRDEDEEQQWMEREREHEMEWT